MNRFANLVDRPVEQSNTPIVRSSSEASIPPSRIGRKAISGYFEPALSLALHHCARKHDLSLQELMAEAFNDVLRKYGESPIG